MNFIFMLGYGTGLYLNGWIGDKLNPRFFFSFGMLMTSLVYFVIYLLGEDNDVNQYIFYFIFFFDGYVQAIVSLFLHLCENLRPILLVQ